MFVQSGTLYVDRPPIEEISRPMSPFGQVIGFAVNAQDSWCAYLADAIADTRFELFCVHLDGGFEGRISHVLPPDYDVAGDFKFSLAGDRVIYRAGRTALGNWELYSVPSEGGQVRKINAPLAPGTMVESFSILDSLRVRYVVSGGPKAAAFAVPILGGLAQSEIFSNNFESGSTGDWR